MDRQFPDPSEIQKDINEYLNKKYGGRVVVANPETQQFDEGGPTVKKGIENIKFDLKPIELEKYLNQFVIDQEKAIEIISTKICTHFNRMKLETHEPEENKIVGNIKSNILMIGPTGVGKTYIVKLIAKKIGVPFVKADATKFSETGYVGGDVEDLVRDLVHEANGDIKLAEYGIIYIDEIDKIASSFNTHGPDVSRTGVQRNLLKLMEESEVDLRTPHDLASQMDAVMQAQKTGKVERKKINTKNILFVVSGAFGGLEEIIKQRLNKQPLGFNAEPKETKSNIFYFKQVRTEDLIKYGFESEFVGRLPIVSVLNELDENGLYKILKNEKSSVIMCKKKDFLSYDINIEFEDKALKGIAQMGLREKTGARGLISVMEKILIKYEKLLPSTGINKLVVTEEIIKNPEEEIEKLLFDWSMNEYIIKFQNQTKITLSFEDEAFNFICGKAKEQNETFEQICDKLFLNYEYGLKLLGIESFKINKDVAMDPTTFLDNIIKNSYKNK